MILGPKLATAPEVSPGVLLISELNCAACHQGGSTPARQSPLLGKGGLQLTPQYLRRYLANPSAEKPGTTMPDLLHSLSEDEKNETVDAVTHFLVSAQGEETQTAVAAEDLLLKQGQALYHTVGCVACHEPQARPDAVLGSMAEDAKGALDASLQAPASVPLGNLAHKTTVPQLAAFLRDPLSVRPSGRMPSLNLTEGEAKAIAVYLLRGQAAGLTDPSRRSLVAGLQFSYYEENFPGTPDFDSFTPKSSGTAESFDLKARKRDNNFGFRFTGNIQIPQDGTYTFYTRSDDGSTLSIDGTLVVDNNGDHAPEEKRGEIELKAGDHAIAATYFNNGSGYELAVSWRGPGFVKRAIPPSALSHFGQPMLPTDPEHFTLNRAKADKGRQMFSTIGCAACHEVGGVTVASEERAIPFSQLVAGPAGCLAKNPPKNAPKYNLADDQLGAIQTALASREAFRSDLTPRETVNLTMARLNCYACHTRDGKGGPAAARLVYFRVVSEVDMGDEGRLPPHLTGVGAKLRPEWTHEVLEKGGRVRPYMATRMPQFGSASIGSLARTFEKVDTRTDERQAAEITQRDAKFGRRLAGTGGLSCIACHTVGDHKSLGISAINLAAMSRRLRYDWFVRYLIDPPSLRPGTRMPSFWPMGEAVNKEILNGNTQAQINSLWAYLESKPETDLPPGLVQGRQELVAETEPIIYRNFIQGAGPRAIGVGYPEKVNLAFDANNLRLAMIWQGSFIDASRHWNGRGEGFEPPLGNNLVKLPDGPPFAILETENTFWPTSGGKEAGYKMGGYSLDQKRRPTFFYSYRGLRIEESYEPVPGEIDAYFKRDLTVTGPAVEKLYFRAATGDITQNGNAFLLNGKILLKFPGSQPELRGPERNKELLIPVAFTNERATVLEEIIW